MQAKIEAWFEEFDKDQNGELERDELRHLLSHLFPEHPPDETWLDTLIERATAIESYSLQIRGDKDGAVSKLAVAKAVERYGAYTRQQTLLDDIFGTHDVDKSGLLEKTEVLAMLNDLVQKTPNLKHITADDGDVEWVLEHCDQDLPRPGSVDRHATGAVPGAGIMEGAGANASERARCGHRAGRVG